MLKTLVIIGNFYFQNMPAVNQNVFILDNTSTDPYYSVRTDSLGHFEVKVKDAFILTALKDGINIYMQYVKDDIYCYTRQHIAYDAIIDTVKVEGEIFKKDLVSLDISMINRSRAHQPINSCFGLWPHMLYPTAIPDTTLDCDKWLFAVPRGAEYYSLYDTNSIFNKGHVWVSKGEYWIMTWYNWKLYSKSRKRNLPCNATIKYYTLNRRRVKASCTTPRDTQPYRLKLNIKKNSTLRCYSLSNKETQALHEELMKEYGLYREK